MNLARASDEEVEERDLVRISTHEAGRRLSLAFVLHDDAKPSAGESPAPSKAWAAQPRARRHSPMNQDSTLAVKLAPLQQATRKEASPFDEVAGIDRHLQYARPSPFVRSSASSASEVVGPMHARSDGEIYQHGRPYEVDSARLPPLRPPRPTRSSAIYDGPFNATSSLAQNWLGDDAAFVTSPVSTSVTLPPIESVTRSEYVAAAEAPMSWLSLIDMRRQELNEETAMFAPSIRGERQARSRGTHLPLREQELGSTPLPREYREQARELDIARERNAWWTPRHILEATKQAPSMPMTNSHRTDTEGLRARTSMDALGILAAAAGFNEIQGVESVSHVSAGSRPTGQTDRRPGQVARPPRSESYDEDRRKVASFVSELCAIAAEEVDRDDQDRAATPRHTLELARQVVLHLSSTAARAGHYDLVASLTEPLLAHKVPARKSSEDDKAAQARDNAVPRLSNRKLRKASAAHIADPVKRAEAERDMEAIRVRRDALMARAAKAAAKTAVDGGEQVQRGEEEGRPGDSATDEGHPPSGPPLRQASGHSSKSSLSGTWEHDASGATGSKRRRSQSDTRCHSCATSDTPEWRRGPDGPKTLCNSCGLHWAKKAKLEKAMDTSQG